MRQKAWRTAWLCGALMLAAVRVEAAANDYFAIHVVDADTGRGIPLVYLETTYKARYVTDSAGYVAFNEPGLMQGDAVWFEVKSYGYESPPEVFGIRGVALKPTPGGAAEIKLKRVNIAERLYRMSGYGIYRDSVLLGKPAPIRQPLLNARITGQDTVQTAQYRGKMYWLWQDTSQLGFGLGCFSMTGGTSLPADQLDPDRGIDVSYFVDKPGEFARAMAIVPREGKSNPIWLDGLTVVNDDAGQPRMVGRYVAVNPDMSPVEAGLLVFDDQKQAFTRLRLLEHQGQHQPAPAGHPIRVRQGDQSYILYPNGSRVRADYRHVSDPKAYEGFTCLAAEGSPTRDAAGKLIWSWRAGAQPIDAAEADRLVKAGTITADESPFAMHDVQSGKPVRMASGSVAWNPFIKQWTLVFHEVGGTSNLGEVWFATANSPMGPWRAARKIATHAMEKNNNDFYNVLQHEDLQRGGGRFVYFEGTFVNTFSGNPTPTPYYDYNNLMYRIDLADPRLKLPDPPPGLAPELEPNRP